MTFTAIGLMLDIIGVVLIAIYDLPRSDLLADGTRTLQEVGSDSASRTKAKRMVIASKLGLILVILGFCFQLIDQLCK